MAHLLGHMFQAYKWHLNENNEQNGALTKDKITNRKKYLRRIIFRDFDTVLILKTVLDW